MNGLFVSEIFGPTIQGEGPGIGRPSMFLRLAGCNLACSWCDTPYAWDWKRFNAAYETRVMSIGEVADEISKTKLKRLVITGGEPLLQQEKLKGLLDHLYNWFIEIETAGTIVPKIYPNRFIVSLKLENSGNEKQKRYNPDAIREFTKHKDKAFKFVVSREKDFEEIDQIVNDYDLSPVYIMPEGISETEISDKSRSIVNMVIERNYILTTRLHVLIYGNKRAV